LTEALALLIAAMINRSFTEAQKHTDTQLAALKGELTGIMKDMAEELTTDVSANRVHGFEQFKALRRFW
jgi:hypothetical protein